MKHWAVTENPDVVSPFAFVVRGPGRIYLRQSFAEAEALRDNLDAIEAAAARTAVQLSSQPPEIKSANIECSASSVSDPNNVRALVPDAVVRTLARAAALGRRVRAGLRGVPAVTWQRRLS